MRAHAKLRQGFGSNETETDLAVRFGGALDSYITEHWVANLEITYVHPTGDVKDIDYFSFGGGIQYRFQPLSHIFFFSQFFLGCWLNGQHPHFSLFPQLAIDIDQGGQESDGQNIAQGTQEK